MTFCKEIVLNNIILRKQVVTLYIIGRIFSALAARDRVKTLSFSTWLLVSFFFADFAEPFYA
jgi:hypothetical protein